MSVCHLTFSNAAILFLFLSLPLTVSCCFSLTPSISTIPYALHFYPPPTCIFLCGWWPQQALANVSSATSSSLQPLMMRKPLLRHWSRVCRQSNRLKQRLTWVANPWERQRTDRLIDWVSLKLCTRTQCAVFVLSWCLFFLCILCEKMIFFFVLKLFLWLGVLCYALTQQQALSLWGTTMPCSLCSCLPLVTKATVGWKLCEGFSGCCQELHKITGPLDSLLIQILSLCFEDPTITTMFSAIPQSTCRRNCLNIILFFFLSFFLRGEWHKGRSSCILQPLTFWYHSPSILIFLLRHSVNLLSHAYSVTFPLLYFSLSGRVSESPHLDGRLKWRVLLVLGIQH